MIFCSPYMEEPLNFQQCGHAHNASSCITTHTTANIVSPLIPSHVMGSNDLITIPTR